MYSLMLGKPFRRAAFSSSKRSSVVSLTLVISVRGVDVFGRKGTLSEFVIQQVPDLDGNCITGWITSLMTFEVLAVEKW